MLGCPPPGCWNTITGKWAVSQIQFPVQPAGRLKMYVCVYFFPSYSKHVQWLFPHMLIVFDSQRTVTSIFSRGLRGLGLCNGTLRFEGLNKLKTWIVDNTHPSCNKQHMGEHGWARGNILKNHWWWWCVCVCVLLLFGTKNRSRCKVFFQY